MRKSLSLIGLSLALLFLAGCASARRTGSTVKDATVATGQEVGDKTEDAAQATAEAGKELAKATDDATMTSAVKMKFARDKTVDAFDINVDTKNGNVTLTGTVNTKAEADRAIELARSVEGVKSVKSNLTLKNR
jgi:osmotically-inducible protein OsmY